MSSAVRKRLRELDCDEGFGLLEVVVAITLLVIVLVPATLLMVRGTIISGENRLRVIAANVASKQLAVMQARGAQAFGSITPGQTNMSVQVNGTGTVYSMVQNVQWVPNPTGQPAGTSTCSSGSNANLVLLVAESVRWPTMPASLPSVRATTLLTPPGGTSFLGAGNFSVQVLNAQGVVEPGVPVSITGPGSGGTPQTLSTLANGCAFFGDLAPGTYTATLSEPGYIDQNNNPTPSVTGTVVAGATTAEQLSYDQAATIQAQLQTLPLAGSTTSAPPAANVPISVTNSESNPASLAYPPGVLTLNNLYPYPAGWRLWTGSCLESDPQAQVSGVALYPGTTGTPAVQVTPGGTSTGIAQLYPLQVSVTQGSSTPMGNVTLTATEDGTTNGPGSGASCPVFTATLAPTNAQGYSITGLPLGEYHITATSGSATATANIWLKPTEVDKVNSPTSIPAYPQGVVTLKFS